VTILLVVVILIVIFIVAVLTMMVPIVMATGGNKISAFEACIRDITFKVK